MAARLPRLPADARLRADPADEGRGDVPAGVQHRDVQGRRADGATAARHLPTAEHLLHPCRHEDVAADSPHRARAGRLFRERLHRDAPRQDQVGRRERPPARHQLHAIPGEVPPPQVEVLHQPDRPGVPAAHQLRAGANSEDIQRVERHRRFL